MEIPLAELASHSPQVSTLDLCFESRCNHGQVHYRCQVEHCLDNSPANPVSNSPKPITRKFPEPLPPGFPCRVVAGIVAKAADVVSALIYDALARPSSAPMPRIRLAAKKG